jgi:hypothetical protein
VFAYRALEGADAPLPPIAPPLQAAVDEQAFAARMQAIAPEHRPYALAIYANAVRSKLAHDGAGFAQ